MALYTGRLLMRGGNESDFDPDKMMPREWAVSTDKKIVRICIAPGICIRMATYDAFEEDMAKIENILKECQTIQEAVVRINAEISQNADAVAEYTAQAKQYRDEAKKYRDEAFTTTPDGYEEVVENVTKNTVKIDTIIEKADLGIKETVSGEEIHLTDSADSIVKEFALFGKATQKTTSGKNLIPYPHSETTHEESGVTFTDNNDGTVTVNGMSTYEDVSVYNVASPWSPKLVVKLQPNTSYILSGCPDGGDSSKYYLQYRLANPDLSSSIWGNDFGEGVQIDTDDTKYYVGVRIIVRKDVLLENLLFKPMLRLAEIEDDTWEPYTGGIPSPNPEYPQEIEVSGESYNLLENTATSKTINGVEFLVNEDKSIVANGVTSTSSVVFVVNMVELEKGTYILSGVPLNGGEETYRLDVRTPESKTIGKDIGNGSTFEVTDKMIYRVLLRIGANFTVDNLTFYPMIRKASVKNDRYMPYGKGSVEVNSVGNQLANLPNVESVALNGVTWSCKNGIVKVSGTPTETSSSQGANIYYDLPIVEGDYRISGSTPNIVVYVVVKNADGTNKYIGDAHFTLEGTEQRCRVFCQTRGNVSGGINETVYPMLNKGITALPFEPYKETTTTIPTPNGLAGIKVDSGGNYTDSNGQQWICDEIVKYADGSGEKIQRIDVVDLGSLSWKDKGSGEYFSSNDLVGVAKEPNTSTDYVHALSTCFVIKSYEYMRTYNNVLSIIWDDSASHGQIWCRANDYSDTPTFVEKVTGQCLYYELAEPIRTPLTAEELAEIEKLSTFYPVTNISNDSDCGMKVTYLADSKNYIDNKLALQAKAKEEEMMAMFLLLPEETQAAMIENDTNNLLLESEE